MLERKEERWAVDKDWETETNCSSCTSSMSFVVPALLVSPCMVIETNVMNKSHSVTQGLTCSYGCLA